jgi:hypothetical protein
MADENEIQAAPPAEKKPRAYTPRKPKIQAPPAPPVFVPETPNPAVIKLQDSILGLVEQRGQLQENLALANGQLRQAQACAESARERLQGVEQEVQYRLGLIAQMRGDPPTLATVLRHTYPGMESPVSESMSFPYTGSGGIGSIPPARPVNPGVSGDIRRETAEMERAAI